MDDKTPKQGDTAARFLLWGAFLLLAALSPLASCNGYFGGSPQVPTGVSASQGTFEDKIEISWTAPDFAGVYHIYRGMETGFTADSDSYLGSTSYTVFIDTDVEPEIPCYYTVTAANLFGQNESPPSAEVSGFTHLFRWAAPATIETGARETAVSVDSDGVPYIAVVSSADGAVSLWYEDDGTLTSAAAPSTSAVQTPKASAGPRVLDLVFSGNRLFLGVVDSSTGITVLEYDTENDSWSPFGSPFGGTTAAAGFLHLAADTSALYAAFIDDTDNDGVETPEVWTAPLSGLVAWSRLDGDGLDALAAPASETCTGISFTLVDDVPTILCEIASDSVAAFRYANSAWSPLGDPVYTGDPVDGSASIAWDAAGEILYAAYGEATGAPAAAMFEDGEWTPIPPASAGLCGGRIEILIRSDAPVLLFEKSFGGIGAFLYDPEEEVWEDIASAGRMAAVSGEEAEDTFSGSDPALAADGPYLFCAFIDDGDAKLRSFE